MVLLQDVCDELAQRGTRPIGFVRGGRFRVGLTQGGDDFLWVESPLGARVTQGRFAATAIINTERSRGSST